MNEKISVLVVDDSAVSRQFMAYLIESDPALQVIGMAEDGEKGLKFLEESIQKPDVIIMDIVMPKMNGFETTRKIMSTTPLPIIIVSSVYSSQEVELCYQALSAGAIAVLEKPVGIQDPRYAEMGHAIIQAIKSLARFKPKAITASERTVDLSSKKPFLTIPPAKPKNVKIDMIGIGASLGGPKAIKTILSALPATFPVPIIVIQQISVGFTQGLVSWLAQACALKVKLASLGEVIHAGTIYIAPDNYHLEITTGNVIKLSSSPPENGCRPSIDRLFLSMALQLPSRGVGILLSGRGNDGIDGLAAIKKNGGMTIVQNEETSVLFDKQQKAIQAEAVVKILPLEQIAHFLETLV